MLHLTILAVFLQEKTVFGLYNGPCTVPPVEKVEMPGYVEPIGRYRGAKIRDFLNKPINEGYKALIKHAKKSLQFCDTHQTVVDFPSLPNQLKFSETCPEEHKTLKINEKMVYENADCWVLKPWAGYWCGYVDCALEDCDGIMPITEVPVSDQFKCRPTNHRHVDVYMYCEEKKSDVVFQSIKSIRLRLPQCCSCFRFACNLRG